ncbi:MAG TPA: hypothetical protein VFN14_08925, partial [Candidatus Limnocylindria bacterium]|nr:hypothetical protein [Candidatus Limnocylindria bacterium]
MRSVPIMLLAALLAGCLAPDTPAAGTGRLEVHAVAGPVCPVETQPPDPGCTPRPVAGATVLVTPAD